MSGISESGTSENPCIVVSIIDFWNSIIAGWERVKIQKSTVHEHVHNNLEITNHLGLR